MSRTNARIRCKAFKHRRQSVRTFIDFAKALAAMLGTGGEKGPADRFQKTCNRLVTLMNHTKPAGERADPYRLSVGRKISQHGRPPDRLERQRPIVNRERQNAEIRYDRRALRLRSKELAHLVLACGRRQLGRYPLQHSGHRHGRSRRPQAIHDIAGVEPERPSAHGGNLHGAGADKDAAVSGFNPRDPAQIYRAMHPYGLVVGSWEVTRGGGTDCAMHGCSIGLTALDEACSLF
jgi:hypothetical protein